LKRNLIDVKIRSLHKRLDTIDDILDKVHDVTEIYHGCPMVINKIETCNGYDYEIDSPATDRCVRIYTNANNNRFFGVNILESNSCDESFIGNEFTNIEQLLQLSRDFVVGRTKISEYVLSKLDRAINGI
jgi:hypothetical protein